VDRTGPSTVTLLTQPAIPIIDHFLVASIRVRARRVRESLRLGEDDSPLRSEIVGLIAHPKLLGLGLTNGLDLTWPSGHTISTVVVDTRVGISLEVGSTTRSIVPVSF
jgi:hypothetical protein